MVDPNYHGGVSSLYSNIFGSLVASCAATTFSTSSTLLAGTKYKDYERKPVKTLHLYAEELKSRMRLILGEPIKQQRKFIQSKFIQSIDWKEEMEWRRNLKYKPKDEI